MRDSLLMYLSLTRWLRGHGHEVRVFEPLRRRELRVRPRPFHSGAPSDSIFRLASYHQVALLPRESLRASRIDHALWRRISTCRMQLARTARRLAVYGVEIEGAVDEP